MRLAVLPACGDVTVLPACGDVTVLPACGDTELVGLGLALGLAELEGVADDLVLFAEAAGLAEPVLDDPAELVVGLGSRFAARVDAGGVVGSSDAVLEAGSAGDVVGGVGPWLVHVLARTE